MANAALINELYQLSCDIQTDKITARLKALNRLDEILNTRNDELRVVLDATDEKDEAGVTWNDLFDSAYGGVMKHLDLLSKNSSASLASTRKFQVDNHSVVLQKIVSNANAVKIKISFKKLISKCLEILENPHSRKYFGWSFLQLIEKSVLLTGADLSKISINNWIELLNICMLIYRDDTDKSMLPIDLSHSIYNIIKCGNQYSFLSEEFERLLPTLEKIILECEKGAVLNEWMKVALIFVKHLALNNQSRIRQFYANIFHQISNSYSSSIDIKEALFELAHLSLIIHCPNQSISSKIILSHEKWKKMLKLFLHMVESEVKYLNSQNKFNRNPEMDEKFLKFATELCYMMFWDEEFWNNSGLAENETGESSCKRIKKSNKIQSLLDLIVHNGGQMNWRWLVILSELISSYPNVVENKEDIFKILSIVVNFQVTIQYPLQIKTVLKCCETLIKNEVKLLKEDQHGLQDLWDKLTTTCYRSAASNPSSLQDYHDLLALLINNKKFKSPIFIQTVLTDFSAKTFTRNKQTFNVLSTIMRNLDIDTIENGIQIVEDCLLWVHTKSSILQDSLKTNESQKLKHADLAELTVLCILAGHGELKTKSNLLSNVENLSKYDKSIINLRENLLYASLDSLIISNLIFDKETLAVDEFHLPTELRAVIDENLTVNAIKILKLDFDIASDIQIGVLLSNVHMTLEIVNSFINYGALNDDLLEKSFWVKKLNMMIQMIEKHFEINLNKKFDLLEAFGIIISLNSIFSIDYHPVIMILLRKYNFKNVLKWIKLQLQCVTMSDSNRPHLIDLNDLDSKKYIMRYKACCVILNYGKYDGLNTEDFESFLDQFQFNLNNDIDLSIVIHMIEYMCKTTTSESKAYWIIEMCQTLCVDFAMNAAVSAKIVDILSDIVAFLQPYKPTHDNLMTIIKSYFLTCKKKLYSPLLLCKTVKQIKYYVKLTPTESDDDSILKIMGFLTNFLFDASVLVRLETVRTFAHIFNQNWISLPIHFYGQLFENVQFNYSTTEQTQQEITNSLTINIQLLTAIFSVNYNLRKNCLFKLLELFYDHEENFSDKKLSAVLTNSCYIININFTISNMIDDNFEYLLRNWVIKEFAMNKFPWFLTSETQSNFFIEYRDRITLSIMRDDWKLLEPYSSMLKMRMDELLRPVLPSCVALLLPHIARIEGMNENYTRNSIVLQQNLHEIFTEEQLLKTLSDSTMDVITELLFNLDDDQKFFEMFDLELKSCHEDHHISYKVFEECLRFIQKSISTNKLNILIDFAAKKPYEVLKLLNKIKLRIENSSIVEQKLWFFMKICCLITNVGRFLKTQVETQTKKANIALIKEFFLRDACYFLCDLMAEKPNVSDQYIQLRIASCKYFQTYLGIVLPDCAILLPKFFNYIISTIIPLCKHSNKLIVSYSIAIFDIFFDENQYTLEDSIALLDEFPKDEIYSKYSAIYKRFKYRANNHSLEFEINHFLNIESGKVQGLVGLKEHLATKKKDLAQLYKQLQTNRGFSEDCEKSILHKLTFKLLKYVQSYEPTRSLEAANCLGELGPSNLATMVLKPNITTNAHAVVKSLQDAMENICYASFEKFESFLLHPNAKVLEITCTACVLLSRSKIGQSFLDKFPLLQIFCFRASKTETFLNLQSDFKLNVSTYLQDSTDGHMMWIKSITSDLFMALGDTVLKEVSTIQVSYGERMLPHLVQVLLYSEKIECLQFVSDLVNGYFQSNVEVNVIGNSEAEMTIFNNPKTIKCMLEVAECVRLFNESNIFSGKEIKLNWIAIAMSACKCEAYFTAIMYCEIFYYENIFYGPNALGMEMESAFKNIMKIAYTSIGDEEIASVFLDPLKNRLEYLSLKNSWHSLLLTFDAYRPTTEKNIFGFKRTLMNSGFYSLASMNKDKTNIDYESYWRLADWNVSVFTPSGLEKSTFDTQLYSGIKCLHNYDMLGMNTSIKVARNNIIQKLKVLNLECTKNIYKKLLRLQMLQQLEDLSKFQFKRSEIDSKVIIDKWMVQDAIPRIDFSYKEPLLCQRLSIMNAFKLSAMRNWGKISAEPQCTTILNIMKEAREEGHLNVAIRNRALLDSLETQPIKWCEGELILEDARLQWAIGDRVLARKLVKSVVTNNQKYEATMSSVVALRLYGEYLAECEAESLTTIYKSYFLDADKLLNKFAGSKDKFLKVNSHISAEEFDQLYSDNRLKTYEAIARYMDREYIKKIVYFRSNYYIVKKQLIEKNSAAIKSMNRAGLSTNSEKQTHIIYTRNLEIDKTEIINSEKEKQYYLATALTYYIKICIHSTSSTDLSIFRITSLWLSNQSDTELNAVFKKIANIPSYKFLPVITQISAHLTCEDIENNFIYKTIERCAIDHPHHVINQIFALANSYVDVETKPIQEPRVLAAKSLVRRMKHNTNGQLSMIVNQTEIMCDQLIKFANFVDKTSNSKKIKFIDRIKNLDAIQCPTIELPISPIGDYKEVIGIRKWSGEFLRLHGVNQPKRIQCVCYDGIERSQLLKGRDDLRQDAVMQQVFGIINILMRINKETNERKLKVRTYKVVPLSQCSGILEWCENTIPIGVYLVGNGSNQRGAHGKYRPNDKSSSECRDIMTFNHKNHSRDSEKKLKDFKNICDNFKPVFQYFFIERYTNPGVWFERRMMYVNSVATNSMIGYILGLGDRHVQNILIDESTAELIHIDFGIAFEQGKILPTPEVIPFRLSRDIVAPMGMSGVEGVFKMSCEKTMKILRQNHMLIMTILEVLLYDPLLAWKLSAKAAYAKQDMVFPEELDTENDKETNSGRNLTAERALMRVKEKLMGEENGVTEMSPIEAQIERLIEQATNLSNLSRLYYGWQPHL